MKQRLQKILSRAGITSRRKAEALIQAGRVKIDGKIVTSLGTKADPEKQIIEIDGKCLFFPPLLYIMLYKPRYYLTTLYDPKGRPKVTDLLKQIPVRIFPVGRLDFDAEGLLLLTNDGDFANLLIHPRYKIPKTYLVKVKGIPKYWELKKIKEGIDLEEGKTLPAKVKLISILKHNAWIELTIHEGRYRQIKRMCAAIGHPVLRLKRIQIGSLKLGNLKPGEYRFLTEKEIKKLKDMAMGIK
ncbi:MAG TPA: rRNA pseudouridine synthase [Candidatus Desulfofervidus auxilii]|uniref:Pseudouridine synthase n=1 Tax=Desulfofervidus auxilii TaxID=1621989 RepID=A0A7C0Y4C4_DESA2|nr:rRNA pseudouridine synthase [Candidatus Desulfofervidus auxilii]